MKPVLIDTDILSLFFRNQPQVKANFDLYLAEYDSIQVSIITYYEILSGLMHRDAWRQLELFRQFVSSNIIVPLTKDSIEASANLYAQLRNLGTPIDDIDLLIAGTALANDWILVTRNTRHFARIHDLELRDWTQRF